MEEQDSTSTHVYDASITVNEQRKCFFIIEIAKKKRHQNNVFCLDEWYRPDRMCYAMTAFIEEKLGSKYIETRTMEFSKSFEETSPSTPIFFILSPGVNPLKDVEALGHSLGYTADLGNFHNVSLGKDTAAQHKKQFYEID